MCARGPTLLVAALLLATAPTVRADDPIEVPTCELVLRGEWVDCHGTADLAPGALPAMPFGAMADDSCGYVEITDLLHPRAPTGDCFVELDLLIGRLTIPFPAWLG